MSTVYISFNDDLLKRIDKVAEEESRTRSKQIREAARSYVHRKDTWGQIFKLGSSLVESRKLKPQISKRRLLPTAKAGAPDQT